MTTKKFSAGDTIGSGCTRCREFRNHTIVAMVGDKVARVECNTCGGVHNYRPGKDAGTGAADESKPRKKTSAPRRNRKKDPAAADREEWQALRPEMDSQEAVPYDMQAKYREDDLVQHPVFGLGMVKSTGPQKIEVLFEDGRKLLRCG